MCKKKDFLSYPQFKKQNKQIRLVLTLRAEEMGGKFHQLWISYFFIEYQKLINLLLIAGRYKTPLTVMENPLYNQGINIFAKRDIHANGQAVI